MKTDSNPSKLSLKKSKTKKIDRVESSLKESSRDLSSSFKSGAVVALVLFVVFGLLNSLRRQGRRETSLCSGANCPEDEPQRLARGRSHRLFYGVFVLSVFD
ncbi:hypothetical protein LOK49_LG10G03044 [Camellia lanceoleosa]|uniref:Uncharacterized protein n=1 Tax=Camellia lanceoleosa TaxID=1840588 RepID=A0ACC0G616_9ERIC|nr:hypothetical protein LOK49_LG10G03044 [Camellia lanceoleosa]